jgi:putative tryptophan/tyrosine transport system substrate-binding protein
MIDRRSLVAGLLLAHLAMPAWAELRRISILHSGFPNRTPIHNLIEALRALGYEDGHTAKIEVLGGEGDAMRLESLVARLASEKPDVIIALTSPAVRALKQAGVATPVVFAFVTDPVGLGIVESLAHPGGNFTGVTYSGAALGGKRLELLLEALPGTRRVAVIWSRSFAENATIFDAIRQAAHVVGVEIFSAELNGAQDLSPAFDRVEQSGAQALIFLTDNLMFGHRKDVADLALKHHLPSIHSFPPEVADGGLMSYGPDQGENYRRAAALADRILKGASPAELPVEEPTRFALYINLKTAKALALTLPPTLLARADEVIE